MDKVQLIREKLVQAKVDLFLATNPVSRRYLTGFTGSSGTVWITGDKQRLITDFRYIEQATSQATDWEITRHDQGLGEIIAELAKSEGITRLAFEAEHVSYQQYSRLQEELSVELVPVVGWVEEMRLRKTPEEIGHIQRAAEIADAAFAEVIKGVRPGVTELAIALDLEFTMRKMGASGVSFDPIVASGPNGALPHARPSERPLQTGDFVVIDFGCVYQGYASDMTRTLVIGEPTAKHKEIYELVLKAQIAGLEAIAPGKAGSEVDKVSRDIIEAGGYGEYFGHGLGHGVGLQVHEGPRLSKLGDTILAPKMVVTVEPGIYLPSWGGVRIEDLVVVEDKGVNILSHTSKEMLIIG